MNESDKSRFGSALHAAATLYGSQVSAEQAAIYWRVLAPRMTIEQLEAALDAHLADRDRGRFFPRPADLIPAAGSDGRPDKNEAWSVVLVSMDEGATVVLSRDMQEARGAALPSWEDGDRIGARMAFLAAYERVVAEARNRGEPVTWFASLGHDLERREGPLKDAVRRGLLGHNQVAAFLPAPPPAADSVPAQVAGLLTGRVAPLRVPTDAVAREWLAQMRAAIESARTPAVERPADDTAARKAAALDALGGLMEKTCSVS